MSDFFKVVNFDNVKGAVKPRKYRNCHKDLIQHPASVLIVGKSGVGKTNLLMNILTKWSCWDKIILVTPHADQPKYKTLIKFYEKVEKATEDDILDVYTKIEDAPRPEELEEADDVQYCYVFDDTLYDDLSMVEKL